MARVERRPADEAVVTDQTVNDETTASHVAEPTVVDDREVAAREAVINDRDTRDEVLAREKAEFGGMKFGSAFFGWLTAAGTGVLLTGIIAAIGTALGLGGDDAAVSARALGITGAVLVAIVMFVAYLAGGYVAGRMARFSGAKQGIAVWLWALIAAIVLGVLGVILGARFDVLSNLEAFPRIPLSGDDLTVGGIITAVVLAIVTLLGAILGGLAGMRYHRRVDRAGVV